MMDAQHLARLTRRRMAKGASVVAAASLAAGRATTVVAQTGGSARHRTQELRFVAGNGVSTLDLSTLDVTTSGADITILANYQFQTGLLYVGADFQMYPGIAQEHSVSDDGLVYTFTLRPGLRWSDGSPFTARDVKYSWERAVWPETKGNVGGFLNDIVGVAAVVRGETREISGVAVPDDRTVVVTIQTPSVIFLQRIAHPWAWGWLKREAFEADPEGYWKRPLANGPFQIGEWLPGDRLIYSRNPYYHGDPPNLDTMHFLFNRDASTLLISYENNEIDLTSVDSQDVARFGAPGLPHYQELRSMPLGTLMLVFKEAVRPMEDRLVRLAFYQAIDRHTIAQALFPGDFSGATSVQNPAFPWANPENPLPAFDPGAARQALARSTYGSAGNLPKLRIVGSTLTAFQRAIVAMQQQWKDVLGVDVEIKLTEFPYEAAADRGQLGIGGRGYLFPDVSSIAGVIWETEGSWNRASSGLSQTEGLPLGYHKNPQLDALITQANAMPNGEERYQVYRQVERMAIEDVFNMPLWHRQITAMVKPWVQDYQPRLGFHDIYGAPPSNVWIADHR
jgi:ABC-type transport system substrate-binding protein